MAPDALADCHPKGASLTTDLGDHAPIRDLVGYPLDGWALWVLLAGWAEEEHADRRAGAAGRTIGTGLLIRGFRVRVPGGVPSLTSTFTVGKGSRGFQVYLQMYLEDQTASDRFGRGRKTMKVHRLGIAGVEDFQHPAPGPRPTGPGPALLEGSPLGRPQIWQDHDVRAVLPESS